MELYSCETLLRYSHWEKNTGYPGWPQACPHSCIPVVHQCRVETSVHRSSSNQTCKDSQGSLQIQRAEQCEESRAMPIVGNLPKPNWKTQGWQEFPRWEQSDISVTINRPFNTSWKTLHLHSLDPLPFQHQTKVGMVGNMSKHVSWSGIEPGCCSQSCCMHRCSGRLLCCCSAGLGRWL